MLCLSPVQMNPTCICVYFRCVEFGRCGGGGGESRFGGRRPRLLAGARRRVRVHDTDRRVAVRALRARRDPAALCALVGRQRRGARQRRRRRFAVAVTRTAAAH